MVDLNANEPADMNDVTTFREVSMALKAINDRLDLMQKVFIGAVVLATGCFSYLFYTTTSTSNSIARIDGVLSGYTERFNGIDKRLDDIKAMIGTRQQGQLEAPSRTKLPFKYDPAADVFPDSVGIEGDPNKAPIDWKAMGVEKPAGKFWIFNPK
jgi:hypothetical protein